MPRSHFEPRRLHGSPERRPGTLAQAMGEFALSKSLFPSRKSLARKFCEDLESYGVIYHFRTVKRQISGIREMGYSRSHDALQPILGGWNERTRRFVYRGMLIECPSVKCLTKSCVYLAIREGLCRACLLREYDPAHFRGMSTLQGLSPGGHYSR